MIKLDMPRKSEAEKFEELVVEISEVRGGLMQTILDLMHAKSFEALKPYYSDPGIYRFLTEDERDAVRRIVYRNLGEPDTRH